MASQEGRSATLVGNPPPPTTNGSADATGIRSVQPPVVAPPQNPALAATVPAVPPPAPHPATLDLLEHTAETLAKLAPGQISALISASSQRWSKCRWEILTELKGEQRAAVPVAFYRAMLDQVIARGSPDESDKVPRWIMNAAGVMTDPRARTMAEIADVSRVRGRSYTAIVVTVTVAILLGVFIVLKMIGWL